MSEKFRNVLNVQVIPLIDFFFNNGSSIFQDDNGKIHHCERVEQEDTWVSGSMRSHFHTWIGQCVSDVFGLLSRGPGAVVKINCIMNSTKCQAIVVEDLVASATRLRLVYRWTLQQENDPKHTSEMVLWTKNQCYAVAISGTGPQSNQKPVGWPEEGSSLAQTIEFEGSWKDLHRGMGQNPCKHYRERLHAILEVGAPSTKAGGPIIIKFRFWWKINNIIIEKFKIPTCGKYWT